MFKTNLGYEVISLSHEGEFCDLLKVIPLVSGGSPYLRLPTIHMSNHVVLGNRAW